MDPAERIIYGHVMGSMLGSGMPVPFMDLALVLFIQLRMIRSLAEHYGVPFAPERTRAVLISLISGCATEGASKGAFLRTVLGAIPSVNALTTFLRLYIPFKLGIIVGGASTYAVGKLYAQSFTSGEQLDADSRRFKEYFNEQLKLGYSKVTSWARSTRNDASTD